MISGSDCKLKGFLWGVTGCMGVLLFCYTIFSLVEFTHNYAVRGVTIDNHEKKIKLLEEQMDHLQWNIKADAPKELK